MLAAGEMSREERESIRILDLAAWIRAAFRDLVSVSECADLRKENLLQRQHPALFARDGFWLIHQDLEFLQIASHGVSQILGCSGVLLPQLEGACCSMES